MKKRGKNSKLGVKTKNPGVKNVKKAPKSGRENSKVPVKKSGKWPKKAFTPTFFFTPKKKIVGGGWWMVGGQLFGSLNLLIIIWYIFQIYIYIYIPCYD